MIFPDLLKSVNDMLFPIVALLAVPVVLANFPPPLKDVKTLKSKYHEGVTISYKKVRPKSFYDGDLN